MERSLDRNNFSRGIPKPFGAANWVTSIRAVAAVAFLAAGLATLADAGLLSATLRWLIAVLATVMLCLDGLDGYLARRLGSASAFGARFDLEVDALMTLALALLAWVSGQAGGWVLLSGLMRYIFVVAGWLWPALAVALPPRRRRQAICVAQTIALILGLSPLLAPPWSTTICLAGLLLLTYSFAVDLAWLTGRPQAESEVAY